jgi:RHS repeat-associated protein
MQEGLFLLFPKQLFKFLQRKWKYIAQRIEYLPYGEVFLDEKNENWNTPYKFNGKEYDEETGLYYYGARYYDPRLSLWLGTDPMQGKYPGISPYAFCMGNPVKFVDPDGRKLKLTSFDTYTDLSVIASTLPMEYRKYLSLNGLYVDKDLLNFGYQLHGDKVGENYKSLLEIVESDKTVEFALSDNKNAVSGTGILLTNTNIHLPFKDPVIDCYADNEPEPNGSVGFSLAPRSHTWTSNDLFQRNQLNLGEQLFSTNDNYQVLLNKRLMRYKSLIPILRKAVAHELYSHILFMLRGKDSLHRPERRGINSNSEFEQWSRDRISETINNE